MRVMFDKQYREDVKDTYITKRLLTVPSMYVLECLKYVKINLDSFERQGEMHDHSTRNGNCLKINFLRLSNSRFGPNYYGPKFYNSLPESVQRLPYGPFVSVIKRFLEQRALYSSNEFISVSAEIS